ncbi:uncharacterized protein LOC135834951 [Planococcus citri]|uniref:uncharacterized protein LOC135834951 n=1 Tax=Planococcus citri TaxID=170843 RepID=UPI0031F9C415
MKLEKKEYICDICKQIFLRRRYFVQHFRRHTKKSDKNENENAASLTDLLPNAWKYIIKSYEPQSQNKNFTATVIVLELCTSDHVKEWMKEFMNINKCNYILKHLDTRESRFAKSKHVYMCRYLNRRSNKSSCQSCIRIVIRRNWENSAYFAVINIKYVHNHSPDCAAILRYRSPSEQVQEYFRSMFENGFSPSQALNSYKQHLYVQHTSKYESVIADRAICPDQRWVYYFYQKFLKQKSGPTPTEQMLATVKNSIDEFNSSYAETVCHFKQIDDSNFVAVILTPLMRRASYLDNSGETLFLNYEPDVSRYSLHVYLLFTACCAGGIPIGVIITSDNSESVIAEGFQLYCDIGEGKAFGGKLSPEIIMADHCANLKSALRMVFPSSHVFFSIFQILESGWKWLWNVENGIDPKYRKSFYNYLQRMMYCSESELLDIIFADLLSDGNAEKHKNFIDYVNDLYSRREEWAICLRDNLPFDKENIKHIVEKSMKVFKEKIFKKLRSYNPAQLLHYVVDSFNSFYEHKLIDVAVNENYNYLNPQSNISQELLAKYQMEYITDSVIMLTNNKKNVHYVINKDVGVCSCYLGEVGLSCKHLGVINYNLNLKTDTDYSITEEEKQQFYYVAVGPSSETEQFENQVVLYTEDGSNQGIENDGTFIVTETTSSKLESDDISADDGVEEVVILGDEELGAYLMLSDDDEDEESIDIDIVEFKDNVQNLVDRITNNVSIYLPTIAKVNEKLRSLAQQSDEVVIKALNSFTSDDVLGMM